MTYTKRLSQNFTLDEMTRSEYATRNCIDNIPSADVLGNLQDLCNQLLEPLRSLVGLPVKVTSGYRCAELNKAIGGSPKSEHIQGFAADIKVGGLDTKTLYSFIKKNFRFTQLILEFYEEGKPSSGWVHVSFNKADLKQQCLVATKVSGVTKYSID